MLKHVKVAIPAAGELMIVDLRTRTRADWNTKTKTKQHAGIHRWLPDRRTHSGLDYCGL